jgi:hypothetical protein
MACLGSVQSLHMRDAIAGVAVSHRSSSLGRALRPAVLQVQAAQALQGKVSPCGNAAAYCCGATMAPPRPRAECSLRVESCTDTSRL